VSDKLPATLESVIAARIAPIIGEMIPEEDIRLQVKAMLHNFMHVTKSNGRTEFADLVFTAMQKRLATIVNDELSKPSYREVWTNCGQQAGPETQKIIAQLVPEIVAAAMGSMFQNVLQNVRNGLQQIMQRGY
jgi:hypothetical protein